MSGRAEHGKMRKSFLRRIMPMKIKIRKRSVIFLAGALCAVAAEAKTLGLVIIIKKRGETCGQ